MEESLSRFISTWARLLPAKSRVVWAMILDEEGLERENDDVRYRRVYDGLLQV